MSTRTRSNAALALTLVMSCAFAAPVCAAPDAVDDSSLAQFRERFKQGLDRYEASDIAGALSYWEPLYRDLGSSRGYRVGYNLARAYEVVGDMTRAAERYQSFLDEVRARRATGKTVEDAVATDEGKASARLDEIARTRGRIRIPPTTPPESVRVDQTEPRLAGFVMYVAPGGHDIVFAPDTAHAHREHIDVQAGELIEVAAPPKIAEAIATTEPGKINHPTIWIDTPKHPFAPGWVVLAGVATVLVGGGVTGGAYANAVVVHDHYASQPASEGPTQAQVNDYGNARTFAYASWAVPATLAVLTTVLAIWYATGTRHIKIQTTALAF